jgi:hypothetical protein
MDLHSDIFAFTICANLRSIGRLPPRQAFFDTTSLPLGDFGPEDLLHGFQ